MAAGILPKPGTKLGPCKTICKHRDCAETRGVADSLCHVCQKPIGYGVGYYRHDQFGGAYDHAWCAEEAAERVG